MFYSQTFLARKGPLGTVWCAAHLQHRLKKSHYTSTHIPSTVDRIMFPEVPIALRMSGHLLLGVVRIYSKKVDYLYHDCNVILIGLRKAFSTVNVNLPEDATHAPAHTITLPEKYDLDALNLDDYMFDNMEDNHLRSQEEITLTDQIPVGRDIYVAITFDEDIMIDSTHPEGILDSGVRPMEEDIICAPPLDADVVFQDPVPSNWTEVLDKTVDVQDPGLSNQTEVLGETVDIQEPGLSNQTEVLRGTMDIQEPGSSNQTEVLSPRVTDYNSPQNFPEIEVMRDAGHDDVTAGNVPPLFPDLGNDATEPNGSQDVFMDEKVICTPNLEDILASGGQSLQFQQHSEPPASAVSLEAPEAFDTHVSFGHSSPELAIRSTPPVQQQQRRARKRIRLDKSIVLPNKFMKKALEDSSDLLRKKRNMPSSALEVWKLNNRVRKEQVFHESLFTGLCLDICNIFRKDYVSTKPYLLATEEATQETMIADSHACETEAMPEPIVADSPAHETEAILEPRAVQFPTHSTEAIPEPMVAESLYCANEAIQELGAAESCVPMPEIDMEIERLRHDESNIGHDNLPELMLSPAKILQSPFCRDEKTPFSTNSIGPESVPQVETTIGSAALPTPDVAASTGTYGSELETPRTLLEERLGLEGTALSDVPELMNSAEAEELSFLEADNNTPAGSQASQGVDSLSVRTRAVAQYLKRHSPVTPVSEGPSDSLSLNKILEGKTRKLCARMFFETLVLKSHGLVDVQQEQPYDDITLKLTPVLSKAQI